MKRIRLSVFVVAFALAASAPAQNRELKAAYEKFRKAILSKDLKGMMAICTPDMTWTESGRTMKQVDMRKQLEAQVKLIQKYDEVTFKLNKVTMKGNTAVVDCDNVIRCTMMMPGTKKPSRVGSKTRSIDTWVKGKDGWKVKSVVVKSNDMTMDGKPMKMGG